MSAPRPTDLKLRRGSRLLELHYADGSVHELPFEYLRVFSPSAEVWGHGQAEPNLIGGKRNVGVTGADPIGQYAIRLRFDDGHDTGLYSWDVLHDLATNRETYWATYIERLQALNMSRDSDIVKLAALPKKHYPAQP
ncbi:MAG: hypothetical protein JWQ90_674 [Hydrocarboniphaga sp.]|uniref:DUF971 domain-containing protein n=1 Tax=Hydrocarboniphaga sp. TaxID=2033016 RepID=UPI00260C1BC9|nr:DUF971 domain-containing protein [Hydrocarboniphaga sp.]MDB5968224.1 hypothetical protein [Hydrocarboniphaga sp.]